MKRLLVLGATGSIGTTCLNSLRQEKPGVVVCGLTAHSSKEKLEALGMEFNCPTLLIEEMEKSTLPSFIEEINPDIVLNAVAGSDGLFATVECIRQKRNVALANKESIVMGGDFVLNYAKDMGVKLIPVDSEHSAIYHLWKKYDVENLIITASGGPFVDRKDMSGITLEEALKHPTWKMGRKITIDSSTLANKGLEVIEASYLFSMPPENIEVTVHRQSVVHSMVRTFEGAVYASLSVPDMALPIMYAVTEDSTRLHNTCTPLSFKNLTLTFEDPDYDRFPMLRLAYKALQIGGSAAIAFNSADEVAVEAFVEGRIPYTKISEVVSEVMNQNTFREKANDYASIMKKHREAKRLAEAIING